jgi:hypothetical protein
MAGIWEAATITGDRVEVDELGDDFVRFLAPQFRQDDGAEFGTIGFGIDVIEGE